jgi:hypothetical protein
VVWPSEWADRGTRSEALGAEILWVCTLNCTNPPQCANVVVLLTSNCSGYTVVVCLTTCQGKNASGSDAIKADQTGA